MLELQRRCVRALARDRCHTRSSVTHARVPRRAGFLLDTAPETPTPAACAEKADADAAKCVINVTKVPTDSTLQVCLPPGRRPLGDRADAYHSTRTQYRHLWRASA